jgi:hypothetical protein
VVFHVEANGIEAVEGKMQMLKINYTRKKECRKEGDVKYEYEIAGNKKKVDSLIEYLVAQKDKVKAFRY